MTMEFVAYKENLDSFAGRDYLPIGSSTTRVCNTAQLYRTIKYLSAIAYDLPVC
jgi:hypothetical protein